MTKSLLTIFTMVMLSSCATITRDLTAKMPDYQLCQIAKGNGALIKTESYANVLDEINDRNINCYAEYQSNTYTQDTKSDIDPYLLMEGARYFNDMATQNQRLHIQNKPITCLNIPQGNVVITSCH